MDTGALNLVLNIITILLGGTALGVFLRYKAKIREIDAGLHGGDRADDRVDFELITKELAGQRDKANERVTECEQRITQLEAEIEGLRLARDLDPFPNWVVDLQARYKFVNREFEAAFLEPRGQTYRDTIGKSHADLWPEDFCRTLKSLDAAARQRPDGTARAVTGLDVPNVGRCQVTIHKFPIRFKGAVVAWAGYITEMEPEERVIR